MSVWFLKDGSTVSKDTEKNRRMAMRCVAAEYVERVRTFPPGSGVVVYAQNDPHVCRYVRGTVPGDGFDCVVLQHKQLLKELAKADKKNYSWVCGIACACVHVKATSCNLSCRIMGKSSWYCS